MHTLLVLEDGTFSRTLFEVGISEMKDGRDDVEDVVQIVFVDTNCLTSTLIIWFCCLSELRRSRKGKSEYNSIFHTHSRI